MFVKADRPSLDYFLMQVTCGRLGRIGVERSMTKSLNAVESLFQEQVKKSE